MAARRFGQSEEFAEAALDAGTLQARAGILPRVLHFQDGKNQNGRRRMVAVSAANHFVAEMFPRRLGFETGCCCNRRVLIV
jgi:hypothetical protein